MTILQEQGDLEEDNSKEEVVCFIMLNMKCKSLLWKAAWFDYFVAQLGGMIHTNITLQFAILHGNENNATFAIAKYLTWFDWRTKYEQDSIVFEWFNYVSFFKLNSNQLNNARYMFCFIYLLSTRALRLLMKKYAFIWFAKLGWKLPLPLAIKDTPQCRRFWRAHLWCYIALLQIGQNPHIWFSTVFPFVE